MTTTDGTLPPAGASLVEKCKRLAETRPIAAAMIERTIDAILAAPPPRRYGWDE